MRCGSAEGILPLNRMLRSASRRSAARWFSERAEASGRTRKLQVESRGLLAAEAPAAGSKGTLPLPGLAGGLRQSAVRVRIKRICPHKHVGYERSCGPPCKQLDTGSVYLLFVWRILSSRPCAKPMHSFDPADSSLHTTHSELMTHTETRFQGSGTYRSE